MRELSQRTRCIGGVNPKSGRSPYGLDVKDDSTILTHDGKRKKVVCSTTLMTKGAGVGAGRQLIAVNQRFSSVDRRIVIRSSREILKVQRILGGRVLNEHVRVNYRHQNPPPPLSRAFFVSLYRGKYRT